VKFGRRHLPFVFAAALVSSIGYLRATPATPLWLGGDSGSSQVIGDLTYYDVTAAANWDAALAGDGSDDVEFGEPASANLANLFVPGSFALRHIAFTNGDSSPYSFIGTGTTPSLTLNGDLTAAAYSQATFHSSLDIILSSGTHTADIDDSASITVDGIVSGAGSITKEGAGYLVLTGDNTFTGGLTLNNGWLLIGHNNALGTGSLSLNGGTLSPVYTEGDPVNFTLANTILMGGDIKLGDCDTYNGITLSGDISGRGTFDIHGYGTVTFSGNNSGWIGGIIVYGDNVVNLDSASALGGGSLEVATYYNRSVVNINTPITVSSLSGGYSNDGASEVHLAANATLTVNQDSDTTYSGTLTGTHTESPVTKDGGVIKLGSGTLTLAANNSFSGDLKVQAGTVNLEADYAAGQGILDIGAEGTVTVDTGTPHFYGLKGDSGARLILNQASNLTIDQAANTTFAGQFDAGTASLTKNGAGKLTLSQSNLYSGGTTINAGTVVFGAVGALGSGAVTLNGGSLVIGDGLSFGNTLNFGINGGTLGGNATFTNPLTLGANVTLSPGNSPGTMTFAAGFTPNDGLTTIFEFKAPTGTPGTDWDLVSISGGIFNLSALSTGGYTLKLVSLDANDTPGGPITGLTAPTSWIIFQAASLSGFATGGTQFTIDSSQFYGGGFFSVSQSGNNLLLNFTPVPEPSTYALMGLGLAASGLAAWRKRRRA
jgi:autotransporter-associated beta strand protein